MFESNFYVLHIFKIILYISDSTLEEGIRYVENMVIHGI